MLTNVLFGKSPSNALPPTASSAKEESSHRGGNKFSDFVENGQRAKDKAAAKNQGASAANSSTEEASQGSTSERKRAETPEKPKNKDRNETSSEAELQDGQGEVAVVREITASPDVLAQGGVAGATSQTPRSNEADVALAGPKMPKMGSASALVATQTAGVDGEVPVGESDSIKGAEASANTQSIVAAQGTIEVADSETHLEKVNPKAILEQQGNPRRPVGGTNPALSTEEAVKNTAQTENNIPGQQTTETGEISTSAVRGEVSNSDAPENPSQRQPLPLNGGDQRATNKIAKAPATSDSVNVADGGEEPSAEQESRLENVEGRGGSVVRNAQNALQTSPNPALVQAANAKNAEQKTAPTTGPTAVADESPENVETKSSPVDSPLLAQGDKGAMTTSVSALALAAQAPRADSELGRRAQARLREAAEASGTNSSGSSVQVRSSANIFSELQPAQNLLAAQTLGLDAAKQGALHADGLSLAGEFLSERPGLSQLLTEAVAQPGTVHRPETPRMVAMQLAEAFAAKGERNVDVALNPEELGRVRMRISTSEAGITVVIQTERQETGELMRRHISELEEQFKQMGFENISFQFSGGDASGSQLGGGETGDSIGRSDWGTDGDVAADEIAQDQVQHLRLGNAGVDMRV